MVALNAKSKAAGNAGWWTDPKVPDPKPLPKVKGWRILVRPIPNAPKVGSIIIPDEFIEDKDLLRCVGKVVAMGPLCYHRPDMLVEGEVDPWCAVGDYILFPRYSGVKFSYGTVKYLLMNDDEVLAVIADPSKINDFE